MAKIIAKRLFDESKALTRLGSVLEGAIPMRANHDLDDIVYSELRQELVSQRIVMRNQIKKSNELIMNKVTIEILALAKD